MLLHDSNYYLDIQIGIWLIYSFLIDGENIHKNGRVEAPKPTIKAKFYGRGRVRGKGREREYGVVPAKGWVQKDSKLVRER